MPAPVHCQDRVSLVFEVDDVDAVHLDLTIRGITFINKPCDRPEWSTRSCLLRDPDGTLIELYSPLDKKEE